MKLHYVAKSTVPSRTANSIHVMKMCDAFAGLGHRVTLLVPRRNEERIQEDDVRGFYGVSDRFEVRHLPWPNARGRTYVFAGAVALRSRLRRVDLVYGRCMDSCAVAARLGIPVMYEAHALPRAMNDVRRALLRGLLQSSRLRRLVVITRALGDAFRTEYGVPEDKLLVAADGADLLDPPPPPPRERTRLNVTYVGHLYPGKGMELIVPLARACPWADVHVVGGREQELECWRAEADCIDNLHFHGFVPHGRTEELRRAADVLLAPYQRTVYSYAAEDIARWMSPLKIFEYMGSARPIVASDLPAIREVLTDGETALLCDPDELDQWIGALEQIRDDPELARRLGRAGRALLGERYTWTRRAERLLEAAAV